MSDQVGTGLLLLGLGVVVTTIFAYTADAGDDRAANCRAALMDYQYEIAKTLQPNPIVVSAPSTKEPVPDEADVGRDRDDNSEQDDVDSTEE